MLESILRTDGRQKRFHTASGMKTSSRRSAWAPAVGSV